MRMYVSIGTKFKLNERFFEVVEEVEKDIFLAKDLNFGSTQQKFTLTELYSYLEQGSLEFQHNKEKKVAPHSDFADFSMLHVKKQEEAKYRYFAIEPLLQVSDQELKPYVKERCEVLRLQGYKVSERSLYRWLSAFLDSEGDIRSLVDQLHNSGPKEKLIHGEVDLIIAEVMDSLYKRRELANPKKVFYGVVDRINTENQSRRREDKLKPPSLSTIRRRIKDSDSYERDKVRLGHEKARKKYGSARLLQRPTYPLQRVEMDHTKLDLILLDKNNQPLGRPTITTALDKYTGYPLGIYVGYEPPSYTAVMYCLLHAFAPKTYLKERFPSVKNDWIAYGLPDLLVVDRGKEFKSKHLSEACLQLDIQLEHTPARKPWYKGSVERHFRTLNEGLIHQLPGTTFSNVSKKGEYDPEKNAVMMLDNFLEHLHIYIVDIYAQEPRGDRPSPAQMWIRALENGFTPAIPSSKLDWTIALMKLGNGSIQSTGIRKDYLYYQSSDLQDLKIRLGLKGKGNMVKYKYDPSDLSKIYVYDELKMQYIEALCTDQEYSRYLNEYSHRLYLATAKEEEKKYVSIDNIAAARAKTEELLQAHIMNKKERQRLERMSGEGSNKLLNTEKRNKSENQVIEGEVEKISSTPEKAAAKLNRKEHYKAEELNFDVDWDVTYD
ncbi:Mu transposase C-terminal domain-containing protein [Pseudobacillus wudalianchiensis]|nr:Mu transposase C-terminal domain-containing protein [Bacillus wudalianchiensis]